MIASSSSISSQTYCHRVYFITRVLELDILLTNANVKIILAGVVSTSDVKTLRIDLDLTLCLLHHRQLSFSSEVVTDVVGFHALSLRVASDSNLLVVLVLVPACCFHVSRVDSIAVAAAVTPSARCALSVLLLAVGYALLFLGSWVPSLAFFCSGVLGSLPWLFLFFRCHFKMSLSL